MHYVVDFVIMTVARAIPRGKWDRATISYILFPSLPLMDSDKMSKELSDTSVMYGGINREGEENEVLLLCVSFNRWDSMSVCKCLVLTHSKSKITFKLCHKNLRLFNCHLCLGIGRWTEHVRTWAKFCLHCNIFIYIRHIWIKPVLGSRTVPLFHHTSLWTHRCLQCSPSAHRNWRVFRCSVQTACCYWIFNCG